MNLHPATSRMRDRAQGSYSSDQGFIPVSAIRMMIVDDKASMRSLTRRSLEDLGLVQIFEASNASEALALARLRRVHIVISESNLPETSGLDLLRTVRADAILSRIGFILLVNSDDAVAREAASLGVSGLIAKPFTMFDLKNRVDSLFSQLSRDPLQWGA
jgi:PleD family two-component response regulator